MTFVVVVEVKGVAQFIETIEWAWPKKLYTYTKGGSVYNNDLWINNCPLSTCRDTIIYSTYSHIYMTVFKV